MATAGLSAAQVFYDAKSCRNERERTARNDLLLVLLLSQLVARETLYSGRIGIGVSRQAGGIDLGRSGSRFRRGCCSCVETLRYRLVVRTRTFEYLLTSLQSV